MHIVDWDKKHAQAFGSTSESLRYIQKHYLPEWSVGKLCLWMNSLIRKGDIVRDDEHRVVIKDFSKSLELNVHEDEQESVRPYEHDIHSTEQKDSPNEQPVQTGEQEPKKQFLNDVQKSKEIIDKSSLHVQQDEHTNNPKEQLKKDKEQQTNNDEMLLLKTLKDEYKADIEVPLKKFDLLLVRDSARRVESRIKRGENVKSRVGYITNLCKEGVRWEESEEKALEDELGKPQLEFTQVKPRGKYTSESAENVFRVEKQEEKSDVDNSRSPEEQARISAHLAKIRSELGAKFGLKYRNSEEVPPEYDNPP
jgi:hypothetical protein